jgi:hypothetical protein
MIPFEKKTENNSQIFFYKEKPFFIKMRFDEPICNMQLPFGFEILMDHTDMFNILGYDSLLNDVLKVNFYDAEMYLVKYNSQRFYAIHYNRIIDLTSIDVYLFPINNNGFEDFLFKTKTDFEAMMNLLFKNN